MVTKYFSETGCLGNLSCSSVIGTHPNANHFPSHTTVLASDTAILEMRLMENKAYISEFMDALRKLERDSKVPVIATYPFAVIQSKNP